MKSSGLAVAAIIVILALGGCRKTPKGIIPPDEMTELVIDMHKGEGIIDIGYRDWGNDSSKILLRDAIYQRHNVDQATVDSSLAYYGRHIEEYIKIYDEVITRLEEEIDKSEAIGNGNLQLTIAGDSANAWPLSRRLILTHLSPNKVIAFSLNHDENWENGDSYTWNAKVINARRQIKWLIGAEYDDGGLEWNTAETEEGNGVMTLALQTDSTKNLQRVFGYAVTAPMGDEILYLDSISLVRERVSRLKYAQRRNQKHIVPHDPDSIKEKTK